MALKIKRKLNSFDTVTPVPGDDFIPILQKQSNGKYKNKKMAVSGLSSNPFSKIYWVKATQTANNPPVITDIQNTVGAVVWTRSSSGIFIGTLNGAFPAGKTICRAIASRYDNFVNFNKWDYLFQWRDPNSILLSAVQNDSQLIDSAISDTELFVGILP